MIQACQSPAGGRRRRRQRQRAALPSPHDSTPLVRLHGEPKGWCGRWPMGGIRGMIVDLLSRFFVPPDHATLLLRQTKIFTTHLHPTDERALATRMPTHSSRRPEQAAATRQNKPSRIEMKGGIPAHQRARSLPEPRETQTLIETTRSSLSTWRSTAANLARSRSNSAWAAES